MPLHPPTTDWPAASGPVLHIDAGVATLTLNRPAQRNSLTDADLQELAQRPKPCPPKWRAGAATCAAWPHWLCRA